jgi:hypothetical protein
MPGPQPQPTPPGTTGTDPPVTFQILSIDGGGLKGLFSAAVLAELEADLRTSIVDHVDLVAGTSTGGLIALALGAGLTPAEIVEFYVNNGPAIFGHPRRLRRLWKPKHASDALRTALAQIYGDRTLGTSAKRLVIPSYTLDGNDVYLFKTPHSPRLTRDYKERMVDVALATTAAPTYLPPARLRNNRLVDGGVWANNPALIAIAEATSMLGIDLAGIRVLSLGTTDDVSDLGRKLDRGGIIPWVRYGRDVLLRAPAVGTFHTAEHLIGPDRVTRIDPAVPAGVFGLDRIDAERIRGLAEDVARRFAPAVTPFTMHNPAPYTPCHT